MHLDPPGGERERDAARNDGELQDGTGTRLRGQELNGIRGVAEATGRRSTTVSRGGI